MASEPSKLAKYITDNIVQVFDLGQSNKQLDDYALAVATAIDKYLKDDVEVAVGQQIAGQGNGTVDGNPITTEVTGKVTTTGKLI